MKNRIASRMDKLLPSGIRKVNEKALAMEREGKNVIHFEIGRPDFDTPDYIKKAAEDSLKRGEVFYTSNYGDMQLRETIAWKLTTQNQIPTKATEVLVTVGLSEAIFDLLCTILDAGDEILVPDPVWMNYVNVPRLLGAVPVSYRLREENDYQMDLDEVRSKITDKTKALVIVTPNNPTGSVLSEEVLTELAKLAVEKDILIIADEVYERLLYDGTKHVSIASLPGMKERTFTLNGMSKAYSMTGWRLGYVSAPEEYILAMNKIHQHNVTCAPSFVQKASIAALRDETDEVEKMVVEYQRRRDYAVKAINEIPGLSCRCPKGAFYIFINIKDLGISSAKFTDYLLEEAYIALVPGDVFGTSGEGYIRMSFANSYENIVEDGMVARSIFAIRFGSRILSDPEGHKTHVIGSLESIFLKHPIASKKLVTDKLSAQVRDILNLDHEVWTNPWDNSIASTTSFPDLYHQTLKKCNAVYYYLNAFLIANVPSGPPDMSALLAELGNYSYHSGLDVG